MTTYRLLITLKDENDVVVCAGEFHIDAGLAPQRNWGYLLAECESWWGMFMGGLRKHLRGV